MKLFTKEEALHIRNRYNYLIGTPFGNELTIIKDEDLSI